MRVKWIWVLLLFPAFAWSSEHCVDQLKCNCRDICGQSGVSEPGAFIDCSEIQKWCVSSEPGNYSVPTSNIIVIENYSFSPAEIRIGKGIEVIWKNSDGVEHTVTAADGSFDSGTLGPDSVYKKRFDKPGTYSYHCEMHPSMAGSIVVE